MTSLSGDEQTIHNHRMNKLSGNVKADEIQVEREVRQQRNSVPSRDGGGELVEWTADCYSESVGDERRITSSHEAV